MAFYQENPKKGGIQALMYFGLLCRNGQMAMHRCGWRIKRYTLDGIQYRGLGVTLALFRINCIFGSIDNYST
jgi:hypothetical protein